MTDTITLTTRQAGQILHQLSICNDLLHTAPIRYAPPCATP